jgi:hypothetical protein
VAAARCHVAEQGVEGEQEEAGVRRQRAGVRPRGHGDRRPGVAGLQPPHGLEEVQQAGESRRQHGGGAALTFGPLRTGAARPGEEKRGHHHRQGDARVSAAARS